MSYTNSIFPSSDEKIVAEALLILTQSIPHHFPKFDGIKSLKLKQKIEEEEEERLSFSCSKSHSVSSSTITSDGSFNNQKKHKLKIVAVVSRSHEMKFKVVKKKRSKVSWNSYEGEHRKIVLALPAGAASFKSESSTEEAVSCILSTSSSAASSRYIIKIPNKPKAKRKPSSSSSGSGSSSSKMSRKADAILKMLSSNGSSSEVKIRQALGDSPDTSKALRMLLKQEEVIRSGTGGRTDPYIYMIA